MNNNIANIKLESFFYSKKLKKKASASYFSDVVTEEDLKSVSTMVHKMVMLPKYDKTKKQLQAANGLVNFVTYDEFEPLTENIIRAAIPPHGNDIYHMGQGFTLPEDYFVDASSFFGDSGIGGLDKLIQGSPKKMTREWLKANGLDPDSQSFVSVFGDGAQLLRESLTVYWDAIRELETSDIKVEISNIFSILEKDRLAKKELEKIEKFNADKPEAQRAPLPKVLGKDEILSLRKQLKLKRGFYARSLAIINNSQAAELIQIPRDMFSGQIEERSDDGFLRWSPEEEIRQVYTDMLEDNASNESQISVQLSNLQEKIENYRTTDPDLIEKRQKIFDFLNSENAVQNYALNRATFTRLMNEFISRANQHGKIMILNGVDDSALVTPPVASGASQSEKVPSGAKLNNSGVIDSFVAANNANFARDLQGNKKLARGKRTIIMISKYPLTGMPKGSTTIEMDTSPVDEAEAKIIVDSIVDAHAKEAMSASTLKMAYDIEKKYYGIINPEKLAKKDIETSQIGKNIISAKTQMAYMSPEGRRLMEQMIQGMGQKDAITRIRQLLTSNIIVEKDNDGMVASMKFDEDTLVKTMLEEFTAEKAKSVPGLRLRQSKVAFNNYITKKGSKWGNKVGHISSQANACEMYNQDIAMHQKEIIRIDTELRQTQFSPQTKQEKIKIRKLHEGEIEQLSLIRQNLYKSIPHYIVLRGKPGTGKSVFADALADLLKCPVYDVSIQGVFDKWLGNTEKNTKLLINSVFGSRNAVYLIDEIDRVLDMPGQDSGGAGEGGGGHATEKKVVADFLAAFGDRINELIDRNVYVIMTTNHIRSVDNALLKRTKGDTYDVEASDDPQDYLKFLQTFIETERKDNPNAPWMLYGGKTNKEMWDFTMKYINENIDLPRLAQSFASRELSFRSLSGLVKQACVLDSSFKLEFQEAVARGEPVEPTGMPMTTANMLSAAEQVNDDAADSSQVSIGIHEVYAERLNSARQIWPNMKLDEVMEPHPVTGKPVKRYKLPQEYIKIMEGTEPQKETQYEVEDEEVIHPEDPNIKERQKVLQPYKPGEKPKDITELADEGMQEDIEETIQDGPDQEKILADQLAAKETKNKNQQGKVSSSSEYIYRFLIEKGVVDKNGVIIAKKMEPKVTKQNGNIKQNPNIAQPFDSVEQFGTYYFNDGQVMMMSIDDNVPPLTFFN